MSLSSAVPNGAVRYSSTRRAAAGVWFLLLLVTGCAVNPATGRRELSLVSESQEIAMGRDADPQIVGQMGLYPDSAVQRYVRDLGMRLAARSERPDLPWTFRVLDDPTVNAFALPGGYVYVTRGILSHLDSEAQLAGVLGHEIGHVTARHGANRMSRAQLAQIGFGLGSALLSDQVAQYLGAAQQAVGLLFMKFGRGDELEADELGLRYMTTLGYEPGEMASVMEMLDRNSQLAGGSGRVPEWLSTHPDPGNRVTRIEERIAANPSYAESRTVRRADFVGRLDGMLFGVDPRDGFVEDGVFHHPELAFRFTVPQGWRTVNGRSAVQSSPEDGSALLQLTLEDGAPRDAARRFGAREDITAGAIRDRTVNGMDAATMPFQATTSSGALSGEATFILHESRTFAFVAVAASARWSAVAPATGAAVDSFDRETDAEVLGVAPLRLRVRTLTDPTPWSVFTSQNPSEVSDAVLAVINQVAEGRALQAGPVKQVIRAR